MSNRSNAAVFICKPKWKMISWEETAMKKLFQLIFVLTALMFIITACKKNDVTEPKDGKEKTQIDDGKGTAPTGSGEGQIDENRGITTERLGTVSDVKEAKKQYLDHVDEAVDYLNGLLNATYAYKKEYFRSPDHMLCSLIGKFVL